MNPTTFRKLAALGLSTDQIAGVLEVMSEDASERNAKARARWHKWKANKGSKRSQTLANDSKQLAGGEGSLPKKDIPEEGKKDTGAAKPRVSDLDAFKAELSPILNAERIEALVDPNSAFLELNPLAAKKPHFPAKVKRVIHLFANGGPSQVDTFDPKPALAKYAGKELPS